MCEHQAPWLVWFLILWDADEKREAWRKLGDRLEAILNYTNIVSLKQAKSCNHIKEIIELT